MDRANVDTDQIIPKQFLKRIERTGFGQFLFFDWRFLRRRLARIPISSSTGPSSPGPAILLARRNFGCGSSREHAPWALEDYGFRVRHRPQLRRHLLQQLLQERHAADPARRSRTSTICFAAPPTPGYQLTVDLEACRITDEPG